MCAVKIPTYDVIVFGGGAAGVPAAVQAARVGVRTLLVEKTGMLGGTATAAGVNFPGLFHAWGKQVIAGIGWEIVLKAVKEAGGTLPDFSRPTPHHSQHQVPVDLGVYAALCDETVMLSGADMLLHAMPGAVTPDAQGWRVTLCTKAGLEEMAARVIIDCSGDANVVRLAGGELVYPEVYQPATLVVKAGGYDVEKLDIPAINRAYEEYVAEGLLEYEDAGWKVERANAGHWLFSHGSNANHIRAARGDDSCNKTELELAGRRSLLRLYRFLKTQPGLENLRIDYLASETGVRETVVIRGHETVTEADYVSGRLWEDALCYSFYPIDLHTNVGDGLDLRPLPEGVVPSVPRGALLPRSLSKMLAAGRSVSSDRAANSALRVQASCMAMGQVSGALAALAVRLNVDPADVPLPEVRALLRRHGAIVPGE
jgi:hypothetical protein